METINKITCPSCGTSFNAEQALANDIEEKLKVQFNQKYKGLQAHLEKQASEKEELLKKQLALDKKTLEEQLKASVKQDFEIELKTAKEEAEKSKKENKELKSKELEFLKKEQALKDKEQEMELLLQKKIRESRKEIEEHLQTKVKEEFEFELKIAQDEAEKNKKENRELKNKEIEYLKKEQALKDKEQEMELLLQKKILESRKEIEELVRKKVTDDTQMALKEKEMQIQSMKDQIDVMKRKAEQGSMQLQGEVQEIILEELLKSAFSFDMIDEVGKGVRGADVIHTVRNNTGKDCGRIIYESKRTKAFSDSWIDKLKNDLRGQKADIAVIVTETMPKDMDRFGVKDGIWICSFAEVKGVAMVLRDSLIKIFDIRCSQENKGDKMQMLYDYLTRNEFLHQFQAIVEGFSLMKEALENEKKVSFRLWKEREKQLDKVLQNSAEIYGSIRGIAGNAIGEIKQLEYPDLLLGEGA